MNDESFLNKCVSVLLKINDTILFSLPESTSATAIAPAAAAATAVLVIIGIVIASLLSPPAVAAAESGSTALATAAFPD